MCQDHSSKNNGAWRLPLGNQGQRMFLNGSTDESNVRQGVRFFLRNKLENIADFS
jgi:hypothetical protein